MKIKAVLFDLDGTLLPLIQDEFSKAYFSALTKKFCQIGISAETFVPALKSGIKAMGNNDGSKTNQTVFFNAFSAAMGTDMHKYDNIFSNFYENEFQEIKSICGVSNFCKQAVSATKEKGLLCIAATNPMFPKFATESRIKWAGLNPNDFDLITTFEDFGFCKPQNGFYQEILNRFGLKPEECVMIGNDTCDDMLAAEVGINVFLLTDNLVNRKNVPIEQFNHGGYKEMAEFVEKL